MKTRALLTREAARHPDAAACFRDGMCSVFRQWTALELALHHSWGGPEGSEHVVALIEEIMGMFLGPEIMYKDDISLVLEDYMETFFNTVCEDESPDELGQLLVGMWNRCCEGDFAQVLEIKRKEALRGGAGVLRQSQGLANGDAMDSDDDSDDEAGGGTCMSAADFQRAVASELGRIEEGGDEEDGGRKEAGGGEAAVASMVDEDGFMLVQTGKAAKKKAGRK